MNRAAQAAAPAHLVQLKHVEGDAEGVLARVSVDDLHASEPEGGQA